MPGLQHTAQRNEGLADMTSPMYWPDGTPVVCEPDNTLTTENRAYWFNEPITRPPIDQQLRDRIIQRLREI